MLEQSPGKNESNRRPLFVLALSLLLLTISVCLNVVLAYQLRSANQKILRVSQESRVKTGDLLPDLHARKLDSSAFSHAYLDAKRPTILYVFSPTCLWCEKNWENIESLNSKIATEYDFVALSVSEQGLDELAERRDWTFPIVKEPSTATVLAYRLGDTPQTILVSQDGHVIKNWQGAYTGSVKKEVEEYFGLSLPGVSDDPTPR